MAHSIIMPAAMKYIRANQHFAEQTADDARGEYAGEQTGYDDAYVAVLYSPERENWEAIGNEDLAVSWSRFR